MNLAPTAPNEGTVFGAPRPGYPSRDDIDESTVQGWMDSIEERGIDRVCCLLTEDQLDFYSADLLDTYRDRFGQETVLHAPIPDFRLSPPALLHGEILPFIAASDDANERVVVHCSAGNGRTGHVLAAWLVHGRGYAVDDALATTGRNRNPHEAVELGDATEQELRRLLEGER